MKPTIHRTINSIILVVVAIIVVMAMMIAQGNKQTIQQCESMLFEKLTGQDNKMKEKQ